MNKKTLKIIFIILILVLIVSSAYIIFNMLTKETIYEVNEVGLNENGTVYKIETGNNKSNETVGLILGIHSRESNIHKAINETLYNICKNDGVQDLNKKYIVYYVKLNDNISSREDTREAGENLGEQFIVPNIVKDNLSFVIDVHMISPYYEYSNFIFPVNNDSEIANNYSEIISNNLSIKNYKFEEGTSPAKITEPISQYGIPTLLIEFDITRNDVNDIAKKFIYCIDNLK